LLTLFGEWLVKKPNEKTEMVYYHFTPVSDLALFAAISRTDITALSTLFVAAACTATSANVQI